MMDASQSKRLREDAQEELRVDRPRHTSTMHHACDVARDGSKPSKRQRTNPAESVNTSSAASSSTAPRLEMNDLENAQRSKYLSIVDQFRELGVNENISLPQLVVVGDQSSGKSSLLEGITGLAFPVAGDLCTRFATQIILRRNAQGENSAKVTIIPGPTSLRSETTIAHLKSFQRNLHGSQLEREEFPKILNEASLHMGLPDISNATDSRKNRSGAPNKRFSDDLLKIELSGPNQTHLSVVDVPGLFHNPTSFQTEEDREVIRKLIIDYISDSCTIIMAVMDATSNIASQEVFKLARDVDHGGKRTVGIITKLDVVQEGDESVVLEVAQGRIERLRHGWFAVKNRSTKDIKSGVTIAQRHQNEKYFFANISPWKTLDSDRCGIANLSRFLGQQLYEHVRHEFPSLLKKVERLHNDTQALLKKLGPECKTTFEKRQFLLSMATSYQMKTRDALSGHYETDLPSDDESRLRKCFRDRSEQFATDIKAEGHAHEFMGTEDSFKPEYNGDSKVEAKAKSKLNKNPIPMEEHQTFEWIRRAYVDLRGVELPGLINTSVVETLFRQQSAKWDALATEYFHDVYALARKYRQVQLSRIFPDATMSGRVEELLGQATESVVEEGLKRLQSVLEDERSGILQTQDQFLTDEFTRKRDERLLMRLKKFGYDHQNYVKINTTEILLATNLSLEEHAVYSIHDTLDAYYKLALKRFTDNVINSVAERYLLGVGGPVQVFGIEYVACMSDSELEFIASETHGMAQKRREHALRAERLQKALSLARGLY